jgi:GDP-4-dehydro-6-deoxy-D-mannose reductase
MSSALVTGAHGFVGTHVRAELAERGWEVISLGRAERTDDHYVRHDLADPTGIDALAQLVGDLKPDVIFHLAASPAFKAAGGDPTALVADAVSATFNLCRAMVTAGSKARLLVAGSSAQYGALPRELNPVTEDAPLRPVNAYGHAKVAAEATAMAFAATGALDVIPVRAFNHIGPGEPPTTVASAFARRIADVRAELSDTVTVGDLDAVRDFTDVRDIAAGYVELAERGESGRLYNLCSGREATVGAVLAALLAAGGLDPSVVRVTDPPSGAGNRPGSIPYQVGSPARVRAEIGWSAQRPLADSAHDLLDAVEKAGRP